ncbi:hypothetical protein H0G69_10750 (plasmid) [Limosilactobacillus mucosae]|uniref:hypothetical protein n=1 Tax=Limosilactobacillus mucosae TaxID=97478 RepID=UPI0015D546CA|nr:hypothetical protein [Limosilactobacillus mucosae]QLI94500.1 hypothetical protein H0G69_05910 [Limosilactobacillus mucosae]QLI95469.1 hypothetical protein H0G69_10750 [Limosilactobacillus mucosae]
MSTKRARQHQWIVFRRKASRRLKRQRGIYRTEPLGLLQFKPASWQGHETMLYRLSETHNNRSQKARCINIRRARAAESAYEWRKPKQYSEIAENLYKTGPVSVEFSTNPEFARKLWEALKDD